MTEETMGDVVEALKAGVRRADDNPTMRLSILRHTISNAIDALSRPAPSEASADVVKPAGWLCKSPEDGFEDFEHISPGDPWKEPLTATDKADGWTARPLFAALTPAPQADALLREALVLATNYRDMLLAHIDNTGEDLELDDRCLIEEWENDLSRLTERQTDAD